MKLVKDKEEKNCKHKYYNIIHYFCSSRVHYYVDKRRSCLCSL